MTNQLQNGFELVAFNTAGGVGLLAENGEGPLIATQNAALRITWVGKADAVLSMRITPTGGAVVSGTLFEGATLLANGIYQFAVGMRRGWDYDIVSDVAQTGAMIHAEVVMDGVL